MRLFLSLFLFEDFKQNPPYTKSGLATQLAYLLYLLHLLHLHLRVLRATHTLRERGSNKHLIYNQINIHTQNLE